MPESVPHSSSTAPSAKTRRARKPLTWRQRIMLMVVPTLALLIAGEVVCRVRLAIRPPLFVRNGVMADPAYTSKPWCTEEFLRSSEKQPGRWDPVEGSRILLPTDYHDKFFTIADHARRTTGFVPDPNGKPPIRIFVVGGSTTYCSEVPDELTWCSQLQAMLAADPRTRQVEIVNLGAMGANTAQELGRMEWEFARGNVPQACIFYDGFNDVIAGLVNGHPGMTLAEEWAATQSSPLARIGKYSKLVSTLTAVANTFSKHAPRTARSPETIASLSKQTLDEYFGNLRKAAEACEKRGVHFASFVQPVAFTILSRPLSVQEQGAIQRMLPHAGADVEFKAGYAGLLGALPAQRAAGLEINDLTTIFDANDKPVYLDMCHVESDGNAIIARAVHARLVELLGSWGLLEGEGKK